MKADHALLAALVAALGLRFICVVSVSSAVTQDSLFLEIQPQFSESLVTLALDTTKFNFIKNLLQEHLHPPSLPMSSAFEISFFSSVNFSGDDLLQVPCLPILSLPPSSFLAVRRNCFVVLLAFDCSECCLE